MERDQRPKILLRLKKIFCQIKIIFLYSTKNGRAVRAILTRIRVSIDYADAVPFFFLNECLSLNRTLANLEWLVVLQTLRGERPKTKDTPEVKKKFFVKYKLFFCRALRTVILKNCQLREVPPFPRACHI